MAIETLGEACSQCWRVTVRCAYGRSEGPRSQSSRECGYRKELDLETLVWTRGRAFPLSRLEARLRCPRCGSRDIVCLFEAPGSASSLLKNQEIGAFPVFLPWGLGWSGCCEQTRTTPPAVWECG